MTGHCQNDGGGVYLWWPNALILIMHSNFVLSISALEHKRPIKLALRMALMSLLNNGWWCSSHHHSISLPPFPPRVSFLCFFVIFIPPLSCLWAPFHSSVYTIFLPSVFGWELERLEKMGHIISSRCWLFVAWWGRTT